MGPRVLWNLSTMPLHCYIDNYRNHHSWQKWNKFNDDIDYNDDYNDNNWPMLSSMQLHAGWVE